jgi:hypothetical protein
MPLTCAVPRTRLVRRRILGTAGPGLLALAVTACGSSASSSPAAAAATSAAGTAAAGPAPSSAAAAAAAAYDEGGYAQVRVGDLVLLPGQNSGADEDFINALFRAMIPNLR